MIFPPPVDPERGRLLKAIKDRIQPLVSDEAFREVCERLGATSTDVLRQVFETDSVGEAERRAAGGDKGAL